MAHLIENPLASRSTERRNSNASDLSVPDIDESQEFDSGHAAKSSLAPPVAGVAAKPKRFFTALLAANRAILLKRMNTGPMDLVFHVFSWRVGDEVESNPTVALEPTLLSRPMAEVEVGPHDEKPCETFLCNRLRQWKVTFKSAIPGEPVFQETLFVPRPGPLAYLELIPCCQPRMVIRNGEKALTVVSGSLLCRSSVHSHPVPSEWASWSNDKIKRQWLPPKQLRVTIPCLCSDAMTADPTFGICCHHTHKRAFTDGNPVADLHRWTEPNDCCWVVVGCYPKVRKHFGFLFNAAATPENRLAILGMALHLENMAFGAPAHSLGIIRSVITLLHNPLVQILLAVLGTLVSGIINI